MSEIRTDFSRGEQITGLVWLGLGALISLLLEVVYLGARLPLGGGASVAFPVTILVAFGFNAVLTATARLWSSHVRVVMVPLCSWVGGFFLLLVAGGSLGVQVMGSSPWTILLLFAGFAGGVWPYFRNK